MAGCESKGREMDIVERLEAAKNRTLTYFEMSEEQLTRRYGPGKWPVHFVLHHLADAETVLFDRIRRVISEPRQVLWAFDQDAWATGLWQKNRMLTNGRELGPEGAE
jgi:hypothetical protein